MGFATDAIHAGQIPDPVTGAVITPLYLTSTYAQEELGVHKGFEYGRTHNFTRQALEKNIAALEGAVYGIAFASGLASVHALMSLLRSGDHIIITENVYGGTFRLLELVMKDYGIRCSWVDTADINAVKAALVPETRMLYVETPTNPMLSLTDIAEMAAFAREHNLVSVVDNTFMSPYFQRPLAFGIDIVLHSTTKYLNGHSDVIGGMLVTSSEKLHERLRYIQNAAGGVPSPFDCWLTLRATKTLAVRMKQHDANARQVAAMLESHPAVKRVIYPGLASHPQHLLAKRQMSGFGGMVTFETNAHDTAKQFLKSVRVFTLAESLGGVESLVCHPVSMTHASVPTEKRMKFGLNENIIRLSVGIEDIEDLLADLEQALR